MVVRLFAENPYTFAALVALAWVFCILLPLWVYTKTSPTNHLKRFPRQDKPKGTLMFKRFADWYNEPTTTQNGTLVLLWMNVGATLATALVEYLTK